MLSVGRRVRTDVEELYLKIAESEVQPIALPLVIKPAPQTAGFGDYLVNVDNGLDRTVSRRQSPLMFVVGH